MRKRYRVLFFAALVAALVVPVGYALSFDSRQKPAGARYEVEVSENLANWRSSSFAKEIAPGVFEHLDFEFLSQPSRFYRVVPLAEQPTRVLFPVLREKVMKEE